MANLRVMVALHVYGDVCGETVTSMIGELTTPAEGIEWSIVFPSSDALLSRLRSSLVTQAILHDADVLIWLDHDIVWAPGDVADMARRCAQSRGVVGGLFPYRAEEMRGRGFPWRPFPGTPPESVRLTEDRLVEAEAVSGGFIAFHVPALRRMIEELTKSDDPALQVRKCRANPSGFFWDVCRPVSVPYTDGKDDLFCYQSDDWSLLMRLRHCGTKVYAWTRPWLGHVGRKQFTPADALGIAGGIEGFRAWLASNPMIAAAVVPPPVPVAEVTP